MSAPEALRARLERAVTARPCAPRTDLRAGDIPDVQLITGVGPFEVDVLVRVHGPRRVDIVGQVTGSERVHEPVPRLPVAIFDADALECAARTETDAFGEFGVIGLPGARYALVLGEGRDAPCMLIPEGGAHVAASQRPV